MMQYLTERNENMFRIRHTPLQDSMLLITDTMSISFQRDEFVTVGHKGLAKSMHFIRPILNRLERGSNVRILPDTYH
jgi:hypothetical protein